AALVNSCTYRTRRGIKVQLKKRIVWEIGFKVFALHLTRASNKELYHFLEAKEETYVILIFYIQSRLLYECNAITNSKLIFFELYLYSTTGAICPIKKHSIPNYMLSHIHIVYL